MDKNNEQTEIVYELSDKELKDFAELFTNIINEICIFADKHNFDRNDTFAYVANKLTIFSEITTIEHYDVSCSKQESNRPVGEWDSNEICSCCGLESTYGLDAEKWDYWLPEYCPHCGAKMEREK